MNPKLHTLHDCLQDAALMNICKYSKLAYVSDETFTEIMRQSSAEYQDEARKKMGTFRDRCAFTCDPRTVFYVMEICRANGTTMSSFLRACCRQLVEEYNYGTRKSVGRAQDNTPG